MASDASLNRVLQARSETERSVRSLLGRLSLLSGTSPILEVPPSVMSSHAASPVRAVSVNVNLMGGTIFLDDERRVRALAKEIKRLITEDKRRGLPI